MTENLAWFVLFLPLVSVAIIMLFTRSNPRASAQISIGAVVLSFVLSLTLFIFFKNSGAQQLPHSSLPWLEIQDFKAGIGLELDALSLLMMLIVTGVGSLIHIYSWEYMKGDPGYSRYFACLSLFTFSMLGIVLADNFVMMFIFWELV